MPEYNIHPSLIASMEEAIYNAENHDQYHPVNIGAPLVVKEVMAEIQDHLNNNDDMPVVNQIGEENNMPIYHFINQFQVEDGAVTMRTVTTTFKGSEEENYNLSLSGKRPVNGIFAIDSGNYLPYLLQTRLADRGIGFRLTIVSNKDVGKLNDPKALVQNMNMAWANASYSFFLNIEGDFDWGLHSLGMEVDFAKKTSKRMQEIARFTSMWMDDDGGRFLFTRYDDLYIVNSMVDPMVKGTPIVVAEFETPEGHDPKVYDGMNYCTKRFALSLCKNNKRMARRIMDGEVTRLNVRLLCKMGVIKGDLIIVPDAAQLGGADFVYHTENLKSELRTNGWVSVSASEHAPLHTAGIDVQSKTNNPVVISYNKERQDIQLMVDELGRVVTEGEFPQSMLLPESAHNDETGGIELEKLSHLMHRDVIRWQANGLDLRDSQNLMYMAVNGGIKRMDNGLMAVGNRKMYKKTYTPMSQAVNAGIVTYSSMVRMGGFDLPSRSTQMVMGMGMVLPDERFLNTFDLHGTWDLDDTADFIKVKIWSATEAKVNALIHDGVLPSNREVPSNESEAIDAVVVIRSPNGPGEYSIEYMATDDVPWHAATAEIPVINLVDLPRGQNRLLSKVNRKGLPESKLVFGGALTREQAIYMIEAQMTNPGIGMLANAMMVWVDVMGVSFPEEMSDVFGEMVDAVQQGFDKEQLFAVAQESYLVFAQLVEKMKADPTLTLDRELALTRAIPSEYMDEIPAGQIVAKRLTATNAIYAKARKDLGELATNVTLITRNNGHLAEVVKNVAVGVEVRDWAAAWVELFEADFKELAKQFRVLPDDNAFEKMLKQHYHMSECKNVVARMVTSINNTPDPERYVLGLYKWMLLPKKARPFGSHDRVIFQGGEDKSVMDLLIAALKNRSLV